MDWKASSKCPARSGITPATAIHATHQEIFVDCRTGSVNVTQARRDSWAQIPNLKMFATPR
jgi:hypothetical protein